MFTYNTEYEPTEKDYYKNPLSPIIVSLRFVVGTDYRKYFRYFGKISCEFGDWSHPASGFN